MKKRKTKIIYIGDISVGGNSPVRVQSMTNTKTSDIEATCRQIYELATAGCEIVRVGVPDKESVDALPEILKYSPIPVIADIHFRHDFALKAIDAGIHGLRLNPGNLYDSKKIKSIAEKAKAAGIPIRVGANAGSISTIYKKQGKQNNRADQEEYLINTLITSALEQCKLLEEYGFFNIKVSLKCSDVRTTVLTYRKFAEISDYPLHVGITEAGTPERGIIKSAVGIGALLLDGIGDTIRVSLTANPVEEIHVAIKILESIGLREQYPEIISCPTCARTKTNLFQLINKVESLVAKLKADKITIKCRKIAVMGCEVNGPGEAESADMGLFAMNENKVMLFINGEKRGVFSVEEVLIYLENYFRDRM